VPAPEVLYVFPTQTPGLTGFGGNQQTISGLVAGVAYNVQVQACNATACSGMNLNGPIQFRTQVALAAPVLATPTVVEVPDLAVNLTWTAVSGATGYVVDRSADAGVTWTTLANVAAASYSDATVANATTYAYRVSATNGANSSSPSNVQSVLTPALLNAPTLGAVSIANNTTVTVNWSYVNQGQTGFSIERATVVNGAAGAFAEVATAAATARRITDVLAAIPATQGTANVYVYRVVALRATPEGTIRSDPSLTSAQIRQVPAAPTSPNNLNVARPAAGVLGTLIVTFNDRSQNELGFTLERQLRNNNGTWGAAVRIDVAAHAGIGAMTVTNSGMLSNRTYRYRVRSYNDRGTSSWTGYQSATTR
jgi:hypothetical protein